MKILIDTNIHLRSLQPDHPHHLAAVAAVFSLQLQHNDLVIVPQIVTEFWANCTSPVPPDGSGLGQSIGRTMRFVNRLHKSFTILHDVKAIFPEWYRLVTHHGIKGRKVYDARIAAAMNVHGITHILTFNTPDFAVFPSIIVLDPAMVTASSQP